MSEETTGARSASEGPGAGIDPVAVSLALGGADREEANAFLRKQGALIDDQRHHLHEQLRQIHLDIWEKWLGVLLRAATVIVGVAAAAAVCWFVWQASNSNGLRIEPFSVPPDLAARGLTGEVLAAKLQDRLLAMQAQTNSGRPAKSYSNSWGEHGIKLEIPETGISIEELDSWLRATLGHDTYLSGEVVHKASGIALTARAGDQGASTVTGEEEDIDALVQSLAEQVYRITQPFRYGMFLAGTGRDAEALPVFESLAKSTDKEDRMWGYTRWALAVDVLHGSDATLPLVKHALDENPDNIGVYDSLANYYGSKGRNEEAFQTTRTQLAHLLDGQQTYVSPARLAGWEKMLKARLSGQLGAFQDSAQAFEDLTHSGVPGLPQSYFRSGWANSKLGQHDVRGARAVLADTGTLDDARAPRRNANIEIGLAKETEAWGRTLALIDAMKNPNRAVGQVALKAYVLAKLGRFDAAQAQIIATPPDCYPCLRTRAMIAALRGQPARADYWFARASALGPSLPFAETDWGQALLARGKPDVAIAQFTIANRKSPHFADPLEGWGEALMAKNQSHLALAKFAEADKYAANWGRLHLKWGEALAYAGRKDEATKQFARAAQLDLTPAEKAELARHL